jgi:hypothetical protein
LVSLAELEPLMRLGKVVVELGVGTSIMPEESKEGVVPISEDTRTGFMD